MTDVGEVPMSDPVNIEQRLARALRATDQVQPSDDLWSRVLHSIEEDRAHRRRVVTSLVTTVAALALLATIGFLARTDLPTGTQVRIPVMELIETVALLTLIAVLGRAIRRFGRGYADDLWPATPTTSAALLQLIDLAYYLVLIGFILMTSRLDFGTSTVEFAEQIQHAGNRIGGLLLIMGVLHAAAVMVLPFVALISNATRVGASLPKWLTIVLIIGAVIVGGQIMMTLIGLVAGAAGA